jgi:flavorubredoxin
MRALVVYESMWGNTRQVATAIAEGLGGVPVTEVNDVGADDLKDLDLLVVGGPTHAFSMSRASTRREAAEKGAPAGHEGMGIREWLDALPPDLTAAVATFDTRATKVRHLPGSAARSAAKEIKRHHRGRVVDQESFYVLDMEGPLMEGELDRARAWAAALAHAVPASPRT